MYEGDFGQEEWQVGHVVQRDVGFKRRRQVCDKAPEKYTSKSYLTVKPRITTTSPIALVPKSTPPAYLLSASLFFVRFSIHSRESGVSAFLDLRRVLLQATQIVEAVSCSCTPSSESKTRSDTAATSIITIETSSLHTSLITPCSAESSHLSGRSH